MPTPSLPHRAPLALGLLLSGLLMASPALGETASAAASTASAAISAPAPDGCTGPVSATWLKVVVEGVRAAQGLIAITLYADDSARFLVRHGSLYVGRTKAVAGTTEGCIYVPGPGVYALAIYHDANANEKFDRTVLGLPDEAYGFSNNPHTFFGLPSFRSVRLKVEHSGQSTHIRLHYP